MKSFLKRVQSICIILILLRAVYEYAESTVIYQAGEKAEQENNRSNEIDTEQFNRQIIQMAINSAYEIQNSISKPYKVVYLKEIPEWGKSGLQWARRYLAYKDMLVLWSDYVYKRQDGVYRLTGQTLSDVTKIEEDVIEYYNQWENLLVAMDREEMSFLVYDMDTGTTHSYSCGEGRRLDSLKWYVHNGEIYYVEYMENDNGDWIQDTAIRKMNPYNGESVEIYRGEKPDLDSFWFFVREDGTIFFEWVEWGEDLARRREYWKIQPNTDGTWEETKLCEIDRWKFREWGPCTEYGFFLVGQYFEPTWVTDEAGESYWTLFEEIVIKDNGETETPVFVGEGLMLWCDNGYLIENIPQKEKGSVTYCDYHGNIINTYQLIDEDYLEKGYELVNLLYYDGTITGFYQQEDTKELYIAQIDAKLE